MRRLIKYGRSFHFEYVVEHNEEVRPEHVDAVALLDAATCGMDLDVHGVKIEKVGNLYKHTFDAADLLRYLIYE